MLARKVAGLAHGFVLLLHVYLLFIRQHPCL